MLTGSQKFTLMAGVFTRPELVVEPGLAQIGAMLLILIATVGVIFSMQAQFTARRLIDFPARLVLAAIAMVTLFHPDRQIAWFGCLLIGLFVAYWILRGRESPMRAPSGAA